MTEPRQQTAHPDFELEAGMVHLNHGSYGAVPRPVAAAQAEWRRRIEGNPSGFFRTVYPDAVREAAERVAALLGGTGTDWAFTDNATAAVNAVLGSFAFAPGDEILTTDRVYGAVRQTLLHTARRTGVRVVEVATPLPVPDEDAILAAVAAGLSPRTRLALFDHVVSEIAVVLPVARLAALCRDAGVPVLVDGAHAPGMLDVDVPSLGVEWYAANTHKWLFAPRGSALLWCRPDRQAALHPTVISHGYGRGFTAEFDWTGTRDASAWLSVPAAIDYFEGHGGMALARRNHDLAVAAGRHLAGAFGSEMSTPEGMMGSMASVRLPGPWELTREAAAALQIELDARHGVVVAVTAPGGAGALWLRVSAQIYNRFEDVRAVVAAVEALRD